MPSSMPARRISSARTVHHYAPGLAAVFITGVASILNALLTTHGSTVTLTEWRGSLGLAGMTVVAAAAVAMVTRATPILPPWLQALTVTAMCAGWAGARFTLDVPAVQGLIGNPAANAPLEVALIVFAASRLWGWPEPFVVSLAIVSYASHVALPMTTAPSTRDMPVTFSFVLFACLVTSWWVQGWSRRGRAADSGRQAFGTDAQPGGAQGPM